MNGFFLNKDIFSFSRSLDFCVFHESTNFKICEVITDYCAEVTLEFTYLEFSYFSIFKIKSRQIVVQLIAYLQMSKKTNAL